MVPLELIILSVVTIINLAIVWIIASQSWRISVNRYFILAVSGVILWSIGTLLLIGGQTIEMASVGRVLFLVAPMYTIFFLALFAAVFPRYNGRPFTLPNVILGILCVLFSAYALWEPSALLPDIFLRSPLNDIRVGQLMYSVYTLYYNIAFLITFSQFMMHLRHARGHQHQQVFYVFIGTLLSAGVSLLTNLIMPIFGNTDLIWVGPTSTLFYVGSVSFSIVKHQLFDIKLAAVRSITYIAVLGTLSIIYYAFAYVLSVLIIRAGNSALTEISPVNIVTALVLAFLFQPVKTFFDRWTNSIFYRETYKSEDFFASLSDLLSSTIDLRGLLERASTQIASTLKAEQAFFVLYYSNGGDHHMSAGTPGHARLPVNDARLLDDYVSTISEEIFLTDIQEEGTKIRRMLQSHRVALVMPLRKGENIAGYLLLGEHRSDHYTARDLSVLLAISSELVIAIQNALSLQEVKELNATLQQRIDVATKELRSSNAQLKHLDEVKDEFMSMASHQLRTPLTSIKGYLSMVLEGDAGKISPQQHKLLIEAFNSSERMVRLIADFLNVSRLQTGKFTIEKTTFDLKDAVEGEVRNLQLIAATHDIKLRLNAVNEPLVVAADEQKIRQVIMNFIDNAIYYSHPRSTIVINVEKVKNDVAMTVVDTGIGVPQEAQARLFTKFFRAPNARKQRPDGTGVGLYLARRVINGHNGGIIFSSKENMGSTFGFRIPLARQSRAAHEPESTTAVISR